MRNKGIVGMFCLLLVFAIPIFALGQMTSGDAPNNDQNNAAMVGLGAPEAATPTESGSSSFWSGIVSSILNLVFLVIGAIGGILLNLASVFVQFMFSINDGVLNNPIINIGWKITRDIANLGFVLAMIIIAVMTILRIEKYGAKSILPRLIAAAILVNFSMTLAGFFLDFSSVLTNFFVVRGSPINQNESLFTSTGHFMDGLTSSFGPQKFLDVSTSTIAAAQLKSSSGLGSFTETTLTNISSLFFAAAFTLLAALTFLAMGLMLATRFVWIAILLILAPIAWLFWVMPSLSSEFSKWWHNFLKWTFFPPVLAFFMYIAIVSKDSLSSLATGSLGTQNGGTFINNFFSSASNMLLVIALLVGGLMTAQSLGMTAAGTALGLAKGAGNKVKGWASGAAIGAGTGVGRRALALGSGSDAKGRSYLERINAKTPGWVNKIPLVGAAIRGASNASSNAKASQKKGIEAEEKKNENITADSAVSELNASITRGFAMSNAELVALGTKAAKEGKWTNIDPKMQNEIIKAVRTTGTKEKILGYIPHLAGEFGETIEKALTKYVQDATKLSAETLGKPDSAGIVLPESREMVINLRSSHITQLANNGTDEQKQAVVDTVNNALGHGLTTAIDQALNNINAAKSSGNAASLQTAQNALNLVVSGMADQEKKAYGVYKNIKNNVNW